MSEQTNVIGNVGEGFAVFMGKLYADKEKADKKMNELLKPILEKNGLKLDQEDKFDLADGDIVTGATGDDGDYIVHVDDFTGNVTLEEV